MKEKKSYFADENDYSFFGNGTLSKLLIDFDCLFEGDWCGNKTILTKDVIEVVREFRQAGYNLFLCEVPVKKEILEWLDCTFNYAFTCNDYPTRYADLSDHWTTISRRIETTLCSEGDEYYNRDIRFNGDWKEVLNIIKKNDIEARTKSASIIYDDIDWSQQKKMNGLVTLEGRQVFGDSYIPVEKMNEKTTAILKTIAKSRTDDPKNYKFKPANERWYASSLIWDVKEEISRKYNVKIEVEQGSLYYRGTWLTIKVKAPYKNWSELRSICKKFCEDYGFDTRKEITFASPYDLSWTEDQKKREDEDDKTDFFFDSMDGE